MNGKSAIILLAVLIIGVLMVDYNCRHERAIAITMVVPNGFRGFITIVENKPDGMELDCAGGCTIQIPANGHLKLRGADPTYHWHILRAQWADGTALPVDIPNDVPDTVALFEIGSGGNDQNPTTRFFVGTRAEKIAALRSEMTR